MHGRTQAFRQAVKADRRLKPAPVTDALGVIQNVALIHYRRRIAKGKRLGVLLRCGCLYRLRGGGVSLAASAFANQ